jgi:hydroxymethylpyrimidine/phosphomethylpyrimidine kinase
MKRILTIAASDSSGGAGIQADIKTITLLGEFAMSAVTALTAQNTVSVQAIHPVPVPFIENQLDAVLQDIGVDSVKTGMLFNRDIVEVVAAKLKHYNIASIIVDPVMKSKGGNTLLEVDAIEALKKRLFPLALMITPNLAEASELTGSPVDSITKMKEAAKKLIDMGPQNVLIKGGHLPGDCLDILYDGQTFLELSKPRIETSNTHGTGCTYAAAIATEIAKGFSPGEAANKAKDFIHTAIKFSVPLGKGHGPTNPYAHTSRNAQIWECIVTLKHAFAGLKRENIGHLIPEVQSNLGYAISSAVALEDIVAFPGRIVRFQDAIASVGDPLPGCSKHIAKIILTVLQYDRRYRSAMNIRYSPSLIEHCRDCGFRIGEFDRQKEPSTIKEFEGSTLEWGTNQVLSHMQNVPDVIFDKGDMGKEPIIRVLGMNPLEVAEKILQLAKKEHRHADNTS